MPSAQQTLTCLALGLVGAGTGLLVGLVFAPASGRETRRMIGRRLDESRETLERKGRHAVDDLKDYVGEKVHEARKTLTHVATG